MPDPTDVEASSVLCSEIKDNIWKAIREARLAWVHSTAECDRLDGQPQAQLAATGAAHGQATGATVGSSLMCRALEHHQTNTVTEPMERQLTTAGALVGLSLIHI